MRIERDSRFELMRIVAMMFIIMGHMIGQADIYTHASNIVTRVSLSIIGSGSRIAVNLFVMIGAWYLVDKKFSIERIISIWLRVFLVIVPLTALLFCIHKATVVDVINSLFPVMRRPLWFASAYIVMLLFSPVLQRTIQNKKICEYVIGLCIVLISVTSMISKMMDTFIDSFIWFMFLYVIIGYVKTYKMEIIWAPNPDKKCVGVGIGRRYIVLAIGIFLYLVLVGVREIFTRSDYRLFNMAGRMASQYLGDYKSLVNIVISGCIFSSVLMTKSWANKTINSLAGHSFMSYIIHQTPAFIPVLWIDIVCVKVWRASLWAPLIVIIAAIMIYLVSSIVDLMIKKIIAVIKRQEKYSEAVKKVNNWYERVFY